MTTPPMRCAECGNECLVRNSLSQCCDAAVHLVPPTGAAEAPRPETTSWRMGSASDVITISDEQREKLSHGLTLLSEMSRLTRHEDLKHDSISVHWYEHDGERASAAFDVLFKLLHTAVSPSSPPRAEPECRCFNLQSYYRDSTRRCLLHGGKNEFGEVDAPPRAEPTAKPPMTDHAHDHEWDAIAWCVRYLRDPSTPPPSPLQLEWAWDAVMRHHDATTAAARRALSEATPTDATSRATPQTETPRT